MSLAKRSYHAFSTVGFASVIISNTHYFVLVYYSQIQRLEPEVTGIALGKEPWLSMRSVTLLSIRTTIVGRAPSPRLLLVVHFASH